MSWGSLGCRCIVCDNGGGLSTASGGGMTVLPFKGNPGFGAGINRAAAEADTPLILITNPDTLPKGPESLESLVSAHSPGTIAGGLTIGSSGEIIHSTGIWPDLPWIKSQVFSRAAPLWRDDRFDWLQGSLMLVSREEFLELGGFSGDYPLYFEDTDLCARAVKAGMKMVFHEDSRFVHPPGTGSSGSPAVRISCFHWGLAEFFRKHEPGAFPAARRYILAKCALRALSIWPLMPSSARGYAIALMSLARRCPPRLPRRSHG